MICPFCKQPARWVQNQEIYGRNYGKSYMIWLCKPCDAYVGCHNNTDVPMGSMANKEMREWRKLAHSVFDPLWKKGNMTRRKAYRTLAKVFGHEVHIGESDVETCKQIIKTIHFADWNKCQESFETSSKIILQHFSKEESCEEKKQTTQTTNSDSQSHAALS